MGARGLACMISHEHPLTCSAARVHARGGWGGVLAGGGPIDMGLLVGGFLAAMQRNGLVLRGDVAVTLMTMAIRSLV